MDHAALRRDPAQKSLVRRTLDVSASAVLFLIVASQVAGETGRRWWFFDLFSHFQVQYLVVLFAAVVSLIVLKAWRRLALASVLLAWLLFRISPLLLDNSLHSTRVKPDCRLISLNLYAGNSSHSQVLSFIREQNADVVILQEVTARWAAQLRSLDDILPHIHLSAREDAFGIALLSRIPIRDARSMDVGGVPWLRLTVEIQGREVEILGSHTLPPAGRRYSSIRNTQLEEIARISREVSAGSVPLLVVGDLNCTPWSVHMRDLLRDAKLSNARQGFGLQPSWPARNVLLRIPIDHVLHSEAIRVSDFRIGPDVGSDHFPIITDLTLD